MKLKSIGEFSLIDRLTRQMKRYDDSVLVGIGDDAAAFRTPGGKFMLTTCDMLVEGRHFLLEWIKPEQLGHKALAASLSDIAAMGGVPSYALVSVGWPAQMDLEYAEGIYRGMGDLAATSGVSMIGGDTVSAPQLILDVMVIGEMEAMPVTRSGALPGHVFAVTGSLGAAAAGLALLKSGSPVQDQSLLQAHLLPQPRIREGAILLEAGPPSAMIDISDGLAGELHHICENSGVGAAIKLEDIPITEETKGLAKRLKTSVLDWALYGGEDYELLVTLSAQQAAIVKKRLAGIGTGFHVIGEVTAKDDGIKLVREDGPAESIDKKGYDHFSDHKHED